MARLLPRLPAVALSVQDFFFYLSTLRNEWAKRARGDDWYHLCCLPPPPPHLPFISMVSRVVADGTHSSHSSHSQISQFQTFIFFSYVKTYATEIFYQAPGQIFFFSPFSIRKSLDETGEGETNLQRWTLNREICALKEHLNSTEVFKALISSWNKYNITDLQFWLECYFIKSHQD